MARIMAPIRFYFDFTSTYSYIAIQRIDALAARYGRTVDWRAVSIGHLFQAQGVKAPPEIPAKFKYYSIDFPRSCAMAGLPCRFPAVFPPDIKLARLLFWRLKLRDEALSHDFARAVSSAVYGRGETVATAEDLARISAGVAGVGSDDIAAVNDDAAAKKALTDTLQDAKDDGVFGLPCMIADKAPFWGADRLDHLEHYLKTSGHGASP
jgi:2-hydroxychromene-2-carboxylate isomerase